jgi:hypothetical protein
LISVIFCSRIKDNPDSNVKQLLDSAAAHVRADERDKIEFLIKFDDDDDQRPADSFFAGYPFSVRTFVWGRGEGRHHLHHAQEYLFAQRDRRSRFLVMTADDFFFTRTGFVSDILSVKDEFCILGPKRPGIEAWAGTYQTEKAIRQWVVSFGDFSPVISARLIEVCQNFGWQSNVDSWLMGLSVALYDLYAVAIWRTIEPFYERTGGPGLGDTPTYNNMELTGTHGPDNRYWFELVQRQARNLYLNMRHGTSLAPLGWGPRRLWRKTRSQPLRNLPGRLWRRVLRDLRLAN